MFLLISMGLTRMPLTSHRMAAMKEKAIVAFHLSQLSLPVIPFQLKTDPQFMGPMYYFTVSTPEIFSLLGER